MTCDLTNAVYLVAIKKACDMIDFRLPLFLEQKLSSQDTEVRAFSSVVNEAIYNFGEWFRDSTRPFFPDYTDHTLTHLEGVLATCCSLMAEEAREVFTASDAAVLILSVLFHDAAMQLSEGAFYELLHSPADRPPILPFDSISWKDTWNEFYFIARRWDDTKLIQLFGEEDGRPCAVVRDPFSNWNNLSRADRLLIGEFIRQHHARFAHEAAVYGIPGINGNTFTINRGISIEQIDIVGLIGRSHNLPLRDCVDYLFAKYSNKREYQDVHAVYLMTLLRVADYLQIKSNRSSSLTFKYKIIPSKISILEHKAHAAVRDITETNDDNEAIEIIVAPNDVEVYLRVKEWITGIQTELDFSWAVLGEVYNTPARLKKLGLKFRRIRSNIDNVTLFNSKSNYVPDLIRFDVAHAELLKLLIGPLYGEDPSYGVRELMQNAVDAVNEYNYFIKSHPELQNQSRKEQEADVVLSLEQPDKNGFSRFIISDNGIGMNENIIKKFFLRAGASFRYSEQWKREFEVDSPDGKSTTTVLRSGRFGIGALAAFLIGNEITVETRHISSITGYYFKTNLDTKAIQVEKRNNLPIGTTISIKVNGSNYQKLINSKEETTRPYNWNWYQLDTPTIKRTIQVEGNYFDADTPNYQLRHIDNYKDQEDEEYEEDEVESYYFSPYQNDPIELPDAWKQIQFNSSYTIYWRHKAVSNRYYHNRPSLHRSFAASTLLCNGFFVCSGSSSESGINQASSMPNANTHHYGGHQISFPLPNVSIFDPNGEFPLSLQRSSIEGNVYPFEQELVKDIFMDLFAWMFFYGPNQPGIIDNTETDYFKWLGAIGRNSFIASAYGYGLLLPILINEMQVDSIIEFTYKQGIIVKTKKLGERTLIMGKTEHYTSSGLSGVEVFLKRKRIYHTETRYFRKKYKEDLYSHKRRSNEPNKTIEKSSKGWEVSSSEGCGPTNVSVKASPNNRGARANDGDEIVIESFYPLGSCLKVDPPGWLVDRLWTEIFNGQWIPYDPIERAKQFPHLLGLFKKYYSPPEPFGPVID